MNKERPESRIRRYVEQQNEIQDTLESVYQFSPEISEHLSHFYGYRAYQVAEIATKENEHKLHPNLPYLQAEVIHCLRQEYAIRLSDMVLRRLRIGVMDVAATMECLPVIVEIMKRELGWDALRCVDVVFGDGSEQ